MAAIRINLWDEGGMLHYNVESDTPYKPGNPFSPAEAYAAQLIAYLQGLTSETPTGNPKEEPPVVEHLGDNVVSLDAFRKKKEEEKKR